MIHLKEKLNRYLMIKLNYLKLNLYNYIYNWI